jgi:hypothetical protein
VDFGTISVPPFPVDSLPADLAAFVADVAGATNVPVDYPGCFALAVAAGSMGATLACSIKEGYVQRGSLYVCCVARKGSGKTPALELIAEPVYNEQARLRRMGDKKKVFVSDVTAEKLADLMHQDPRGLLLIRDELAGWLLSFNQYKASGHGSDRQFFLSAWSGSPVSVDRKSKDTEPLYVRYPCLSVVGTIQPSVLDRFRADADDGFYDRVLFCYPNELPLVGENWLTVNPALAARWAEAVHGLRHRTMTESPEGPRPFFLRLDAEARGIWQAWTADVADQVNAEGFDETLRGPSVKLAGYAARLALISHALRVAFGESVPSEIQGEDMRRGVALGCYFLGHAVRAWTASGVDSRTGPARKVLAWLKKNGQAAVSRRDIWRGLRRSFDSTEALDAPIKTLVEHGYIRIAPASLREKGATTRYELNPAVLPDPKPSPLSPGLSPVTTGTKVTGVTTPDDSPAAGDASDTGDSGDRGDAGDVATVVTDAGGG